MCATGGDAAVILQPDFWEGVRCDFNKQVNPNFVISHGITMGDSRAPPMYTFSANYLGPLVRGRISRRNARTSRVRRLIAVLSVRTG